MAVVRMGAFLPGCTPGTVPAVVNGQSTCAPAGYVPDCSPGTYWDSELSTCAPPAPYPMPAPKLHFMWVTPETAYTSQREGLMLAPEPVSLAPLAPLGPTSPPPPVGYTRPQAEAEGTPWGLIAGVGALLVVGVLVVTKKKNR